MKSEYRKMKSQLMLHNLSDHPLKVPDPDQNEMMKMLHKSMETAKFNNNKALKMGYELWFYGLKMRRMDLKVFWSVIG